ncbi:MAG: YicC family protein [Acidobacteria bacterium]|nr:YicC family protein [Acidobacteriota bacterium]
MTGFAAATVDDPRGSVSVTIRSVNHRFLDLQLRLPPALADLEPRVRGLVQRGLARGRVELQASLQPRGAAAPVVELNENFVLAVTSAIEVARAAGLVQGPLTPGDLLRLPQALAIRERGPEQEVGASWGDALETVVARAVAALDEMRAREGALLRVDLATRKQTLATLIAAVVAAAESGRAQLEWRLLERARELSGSLPIDQSSLAQEVVRAAQRSDITEEVTRFRAHLEHWDVLTDGDEPCGRKLDFLLQEMNREVNTIGSKADGLQVSGHIIDVKAELERMREQVQNVE